MTFIYTPSTKTITLCYEMVNFLGQQWEKDRAKGADIATIRSHVISAVIFLFFHELGHAVIDMYHLPVTGREEDVADQFALVSLLQGNYDNPERQRQLVLGALWFFEKSEQAEVAEEKFRNEHALGK